MAYWHLIQKFSMVLFVACSLPIYGMNNEAKRRKQEASRCIIGLKALVTDERTKESETILEDLTKNIVRIYNRGDSFQFEEHKDIALCALALSKKGYDTKNTNDLWRLTCSLDPHLPKSFIYQTVESARMQNGLIKMLTELSDGNF